MIKLLVEREITGATIPIRWCIEKDSLNALKARMAEERVKNPYILLVIVSRYSEERILTPFDQMMEYIQLRHPGENKIFATVVWDWDKKGYKDLWRRFIKREDGRYNNTLVCAGAFDPPGLSIGKTELAIDIPAELFAKKPSVWEEKWVNFFFETRAKDQCQYRRRRILAYTAQPLLILPWLLAKLGVRWATITLLLALGLWFYTDDTDDSWNPKKWKPYFHFSPLIHPWRDDYFDLFTDHFSDISEEFGPIIIFMSIYIIVPIALTKKFFQIFGKIISLGKKMSAELVGKLFSASVILSLGKIMGDTAKAVAKSLSWLASIIPWPEPKEEKWIPHKATVKRKMGQPLAAPRDIYQMLLCENTSSIKPKEVVSFRKKIHLQYQDLKMKVCKPFAN